MDFDKLFEELDLWKRLHPEEIGHRSKYQELFSEKKLLSFSSLRKIIAGYYPVIVDEKDGHYYYYHIEWMRQCDVIKFKGNGVICPLKLLIPSIFSVIW